MNNNLPPTLGVVAISFNEEKDLPGFIAHLEPWVDAIVIVDDGSTDSTAFIATTSDKVTFINSPRDEGEYFSHQRNKGIDAANNDWLLHMDIDERVTPALAAEIQAAIRDSSKDAFRFRRLNFFLHRAMKGGGWQDWNLVHLARRNIFRFGGMYHEDCLVDATPDRIGQLQEKMWHFNDDSFQERMRKSDFYVEELAANLVKSGIKIGWFHLIWLPKKEFLKKYFFKFGFRDGVPGLMFAFHAATAMFRACSIVWDEQNRIERETIEEEFRDLSE